MKKKLLILTTVLMFILVGCSENIGKESTEKKVNSDKGEETKVEYSVIQKEDISTGAAKRFSWDVVIKEKSNKKELKALSEQIIEEAKEEKAFNAIVVGFYDYEEYIGKGHTLGKVEYAPDGDWGKADTVKAGDYDEMDYNYELREKDWDKQLIREEVDIYKAWDNKLDEGQEEDEAIKEVAEQYDISTEEVNNILMKQITWMFDDN